MFIRRAVLSRYERTKSGRFRKLKVIFHDFWTLRKQLGRIQPALQYINSPVLLLRENQLFKDVNRRRKKKLFLTQLWHSCYYVIWNDIKTILIALSPLTKNRLQLTACRKCFHILTIKTMSQSNFGENVMLSNRTSNSVLRTLIVLILSWIFYLLID